MNKYNIVWAIVDSVRKYHSNDDRSRLQFMDEFSKQSIEFSNVVTSAPSTVMSISAMMTSFPSYYIGRNYSDFRFDSNFFTTLSSILNNNNYETRALIMHKEIREKLRVFDLIDKKYWPKNFSHRNWWNNSMIYQLLENSLVIDNKKYEKPIFWFLDFNCRKDNKTSNIVKNSFNLLKKYNFNDDNTIFILCSDHGYPDPRRGISPEELKRKKLTHDIFMTDDNITIPLFIKYPGCSKGTKFKKVISTLDIMPTILDILEINVKDELRNKWKGISLLKYLKNDSNYPHRYIRTDARFFGQPGRVSALRDNNFKYIFHHDNNVEEFYDVSRLRLNEKKIDKSHSQFLKFKKEFNKQEKEAFNFQLSYSIYKLKKQFNKIKVNNDDSIIILLENNNSFSLNIKKTLSNFFNINKIFIYDVGDINLSDINKIKKYKYLIIIEDSANKKNIYKINNILKLINYEKKIIMDMNMNLSVKNGEIIRYLKTIYINRFFYFQEPSLFFYEFIRILKIIKSRYLS